MVCENLHIRVINWLTSGLNHIQQSLLILKKCRQKTSNLAKTLSMVSYNNRERGEPYNRPSA